LRDFLETDAEKLQEDAVREFEAAAGEALYAGDERRILINTMAGLAAVALGHLNKLLNMDFPQHAEGEYLDELGAARGVERLQAQYAAVTLEYTLSAAQASDVTIPAGTRATPDGMCFFATVRDLVIPAGELSGTVTAEATVAGSAFNGFDIGTISQQVDLVPFVASVSNMDASQGGAETEDDESYRKRITLSLASYSAAGSELSYIYWTHSADSTIADVAVHSPQAGEVVVTVLLEDGQTPGQAVLDRVEDMLSARSVRPLTDWVTVQAPVEVPYTIDATYYIDSAAQAEEADIRQAVEAAVDEYVSWQRAVLGRHLNPDALVQRMLNAGASRVVVAMPVFAELGPDELAVVSGDASVTYGGLV
jgi:phage-related baseplate assembly protein